MFFGFVMMFVLVTTLQLTECGTNMIWPVHLSNNAFQYFFQKPYWEKNAVIHEIKKNRYKALLLLWSDIIRVSVSSLQTDLMFFICPYVSLAKWRSHASFIQSFIHLACLRVCTRTNICTSNNVKTPQERSEFPLKCAQKQVVGKTPDVSF